MMQSSRRVWGAIALVALSCYGTATEPAGASPLALYVPQMAVPKVPQVPVEQSAPVPQLAVPGEQPRAPLPQMSVPSAANVPQMENMQTVSGMPQLAEVPVAMVQPIAEEPASPLAFFGGFVGGLAAGAAFVYSLLMRTGQNASVETKKLELGALTSVAVEQPANKSVGFFENKDLLELSQLNKQSQRALSAAAAAAVAFQSGAAHAENVDADAVVAQVTNLVATNSSDFGGSTIPVIGLGVLAATISLLAGPVED